MESRRCDVKCTDASPCMLSSHLSLTRYCLQTKYKVKMDDGKGLRVVTAKQLAFADHPPECLPVGSRIIGMCALTLECLPIGSRVIDACGYVS